MKKTLLLAISATFFFQARASDTLTVRQVFNFSVGDTLDFIEYYYGYPTTDHHPVESTSFYRHIVVGKSSNNDTIFYTYKDTSGSTLYPFVFKPLSTFYTNLDKSILYYDSVNALNLDSFCTFDVGNISGHISNAYRRTTKSLRVPFACFPYADDSFAYVERIGLLYSAINACGGNPDNPGLPLTSFFKTRLVYFSNGSETFGKPYYLSTGQNEIQFNDDIRCFPSPATAELHLSVTRFSNACTLIVSDILGKDIYNKSVDKPETTHDICSLPSGIYTWRLVSDNTILKTGKVVKE